MDLNGIETLICRFTDVSGELKEKRVKVRSGNLGKIWTDGSSFGMRPISNSDLLLEPDWDSVRRIHGKESSRLVFCDLYGRVKGKKELQPVSLSPRQVLKDLSNKVQEEHKLTYFTGPEMEFFLLPTKDGKPIFEFSDSDGYFSHLKEKVERFFEEVDNALERSEINLEAYHHEVSSGQCEVSFEYADAVTSADNVQLLKEILKDVSQKHGMYATFMPKPFPGVNGSGMHVHQSLGLEETNAFASEGKLSDLAMQFIAGQLNHARALPGAIAPTVNSYKRLVPGYEAPVYACWSAVNRSVMIRVPLTDGSEKATRIELRCPDPSSNPYVAFTAMLAAGMDGIKKGMKAPAPVDDENVYKLAPSARREMGIKDLPSSLTEAVTELEHDRVLMDALGDFGPVYLEHLRKDADEYRLIVTEWERERYLTR